MTDRGKPLSEESVEVGAVTRDDPPAARLAHLNRVLRVNLTDGPITSVIVDGYEESSSIVLVRPGARNIVFPGAAAMLNQTRLPAVVGSVIRRRLPKFTKDEAYDIADLIWSLSTMRNIYDSVESAADWGRSYVYAASATGPILNGTGRVDGEVMWNVFSHLKSDEAAAATADVAPPARVLPWHDGERLVIRPWLHRHVQRDLGHEALSEQRIASLMGMAGWTSLPRARSALTAHDPAKHSRTIQLRFYVVPDGWENGLDDDAEAVG
jgi:hypothetical protein